MCGFCLNLRTDHIFEQILYSSDPALSEAQDILQNILCRRLYKCVGQTTPDSYYNVSQVRGHNAHVRSDCYLLGLGCVLSDSSYGVDAR